MIASVATCTHAYTHACTHAYLFGRRLTSSQVLQHAWIVNQQTTAALPESQNQRLLGFQAFRTHPYAHTHTHTHTYTHTHTHIHTHMEVWV